MKKILPIIFVLLIVIGLVGAYRYQMKSIDSIHIAIAGPISGKGESIGRYLVQGIELYLKQVNENGGINGNEVVLDIYDDQNNAEIAKEKALEIARDNRAIAVIGHYFSSCSIVAGKVYQKNKIPAITPGSTNIKVTKDNNFYFRTVFNDQLQGRFLAHYSKKILKKDIVSIIYDDDSYGRYLAQIFETTSKKLGVKIAFKRKFSTDKNNIDSNIGEIFKDFQNKITQDKTDMGLIFLATHATEGVKLVRLIKDAGIQNPVMTPDAFASESFQRGFSKFPNEITNPDYYTNGIFTTTPLIFDTANAQAQYFKESYIETYGENPDWRAAFAYDSTMILIHAIKTSGITGKKEKLDKERVILRTYLSTLTSPKNALKGVTGLNYFDKNGDSVRPVSVGIYKNGNIISTSTQLNVISDIEYIPDLQDALLNERIISIDDKPMYKTNVIYTGVKINETFDLDIENLSYSIDFFLWFRFHGNIDPQNIEFLDAIDPIELANPVEEKLSDDVNYLKYHVRGRFKADYLPLRHTFKQHILGVSFRHKKFSRNNLIYVPDILGMRMSSQESMLSRLKKEKVLRPVYGWSMNRIVFFQDIIKVDSTGDPDYLHISGGVVDYSRFNAGIRIIKNQLSMRGGLPPELSDNLVVIECFILILICILSNKTKLKIFPRSILLMQALITFLILLSLEISVVNHFADRVISYHISLIMRFFDILWWLIPAYFVTLAMNTFLWIPLEEQTGRKIPDIARLFFVVVVYMLACFGIVAFIFDQKINGLLATSGMIAMIVGLAIQINISNVFSGIAINIERPFRTGDWVKIGSFDEGKVVDITWRSTLIETRNDCILNIPNSTVSESDIQNFHYPNEIYRSWFRVHIDHTHTPGRIKKILLDALLSTERVLKEPEPTVRFMELSDWSADYLVSYSSKNYGYKIVTNEEVWISVWTHLNRAGIKPAIQMREIRMFEGIKERGEKAITPGILLEEVDIFSSFSDENKLFLSKKMRLMHFRAGETIIKQGDEGDSLFVIGEGVVGVWIELEDGGQIEIVRLGAGNFF